ncbi:glycosyltransferase family 2 protein [uncultured Roseovarius sp.]|uniref:glycosyltransferase family 2 protein n=1 Tax=uncultured Roseovarius sp. TaxID=293344 RepID=UPI002638D198|nr:glycosyltransferase family 2 protein [uncultured Roseovarius sp.]
MPKKPKPHVVILMAVYNGGEFLSEQLQSIVAQDHPHWQLIASDDGSSDGSARVLEEFAATTAATCLSGPGQGGAANFLSLIRRAADHAPPDHWLAFCDQDDVWLPDKVSRGVAALEAEDPQRPALYCSRTWIVDDTLDNRRLSAERPRCPSFRNALVQNVASGNTIILNAAAARLVEASSEHVERVVVHDWWVYQLITGAGGVVVHDDAPTLFYRQHGVNQIGANDTGAARLRRLWQLLQGQFRDWNETNIAALSRLEGNLTQENRQILSEFVAMREGPLPNRLARLHQLGLYRQSRISTLALWVSVVLKRL